MHVVHVLAVEADDEDEVEGEVESALEPYGDGDVWDWYQIGGRWDNYFDPHGNYLNFLTNPQLFNKKIEEAIASRDRFFREEIRSFSGMPLTSINETNLFGFPIQDPEACIDRINKSNQDDANAWQKLLSCNTIGEYDEWCRANKKGGLIGYRMYRLGRIVAGYYCFDSMFYDIASGSADTTYLTERLEKEPERQWLVAVDLHN